MALEVSIHDQWTPLLLSLWQGARYERVEWQSKIIHIMVIHGAKGEKDQCPTLPSRKCPPVT
jgi:hypothetical protein